MLYQIIVAVFLTLCALNVFINLRTLRTPRSDSKVPEPAPLVSVMIPARDEELNIEACVKSLQEQDYPNYEVLVLDDNSADNTGAIVSQMAAADSRVRLLKGQTLPQGWAGKPFACYQLAQEAKGSWLLFVDADTTHAPHMIRSTLALAQKLGAAMLSGFPRQIGNSLSQKIAIPVIYFIVMTWFPLWWLRRSKKPKPSMAIGQFLLFQKEAYWGFGGHKAVSNKIMEDIWLGLETVKHGGRHVTVNLSSVVSTSMFHDVVTMWEGFLKWLHSIAAFSLPGMIGLIIVAYVLFLAPFYWLAHDFFVVAPPTDWRFITLYQVLLIIFLRWLVDRHFKESVISCIFHQVGFFFILLAGIFASGQHAMGKDIRWKNRAYSQTSGVK